MRRDSAIRIIVLGSILVILGSNLGCIGTPFHIAGDVADASFSAVGAVVEAPFHVAEAVVDASVPDFWVRYTEHRVWTVERGEISLVDAETDNGSIAVRGTDGQQIRIQAWVYVRGRRNSTAERFAEKVEIYVSQEGEKLRIYREYPRPHRGVRVAVRYEIEIPSNMDLNLKTSDGRISIAHVVGTVNAGTSDGGIEVQHAEGNFDLHTSDGRIELESFSGHIHAETSDGSIKASINHLDEGVFLTSDGSVEIDILEDVGRVRAETSDGSIHLALPEHFAGQVDARTSDGRVHSEFPVTVTSAGKKKLVGSIGAGGQSKINLKTSDGSIHLKKIH